MSHKPTFKIAAHTLLPDLAVMKLSADVLDACPKLLALTKLSRRPGGSKTGSSLSPAALCATLRALVKDPALHPHRLCKHFPEHLEQCCKR